MRVSCCVMALGATKQGTSAVRRSIDWRTGAGVATCPKVRSLLVIGLVYSSAQYPPKRRPQQIEAQRPHSNYDILRVYSPGVHRPDRGLVRRATGTRLPRSPLLPRPASSKSCGTASRSAAAEPVPRFVILLLGVDRSAQRSAFRQCY
jgi:hypothetical protein